MHFSFLKPPPPPTIQTDEAPVRDKEFDSLKGAHRTWVLRNVEHDETPTGLAGGDPAKPVGEQPVVRLFTY